ncbi:hypothetical protein H6758_03905 [Candidatus Nomurabacteria bacterium]|nr:hypothetical protein [Candidatus Nomurabacteria bacterium]
MKYFFFLLLSLLVVSPAIAIEQGSTDTLRIETGEEFISVDKEVACSLSKETPYKSPESSSVYYISSDCMKRPIKNASIYFSYFNNWSAVQVTTAARLRAIADHPLGFLPWGPQYAPIDGSLFKSVDDPRVYLVLKGKRYAIADAENFSRLGFEWNWIEDVDIRVLEKLAFAGTLGSGDSHPDGMILKYQDRPDLYVLENGRRRHIADMQTWNKLSFRKDRYVTLPVSFSYDIGAQLKL